MWWRDSGNIASSSTLYFGCPNTQYPILKPYGWLVGIPFKSSSCPTPVFKMNCPECDRFFIYLTKPPGSFLLSSSQVSGYAYYLVVVSTYAWGIIIFSELFWGIAMAQPDFSVWIWVIIELYPFRLWVWNCGRFANRVTQFSYVQHVMPFSIFHVCLASCKPQMCIFFWEGGGGFLSKMA